MNHKKTFILLGTIITIASFICLIFPAQAASTVQVKSNEETLLKFDTDSGLVVRLYRKNKEEQIYINIFDKNKSSFIANEASVKNIENSQEETQENFFWEIFKVFLPPLANASAFLLVGLVIWFNRLRILNFIEKLNLKSFSFGDFKIELIESAINKIYSTKKLYISEEKRSEIENILEYSAPFVRKKNILWVDDCPQNNQSERELFSQLKIYIKCCRTSAEAKKELFDRDKKYDLMISDWNRKPKLDNNEPEGKRFVEEIRSLTNQIPVIFYHGTYEGDLDKDSKIANIDKFSKSQTDVSHTADPDELITLTMKELVSSSLLPLLKP